MYEIGHGQAGFVLLYLHDLLVIIHLAIIAFDECWTSDAWGPVAKAARIKMKWLVLNVFPYTSGSPKHNNHPLGGGERELALMPHH